MATHTPSSAPQVRVLLPNGRYSYVPFYGLRPHANRRSGSYSLPQRIARKGLRRG